MYMGDKMGKRKAQATVEFMILIAAILILFTAVSYLSGKVNLSIRYNEQKLSAIEICEDAAWSINEVYSAGDGSRKSIYIPETMKTNHDFNLTVYPDDKLVEITWLEKHYTVPVVSSSISGSLQISAGWLNITNVDGGVQLVQ